jgi:hypothetical protein
MRKVQTIEKASSKYINQTRLVSLASVQDAHPRAQGVRCGVSQQLSHEGIENDCLQTELHIKCAITSELNLPYYSKSVFVNICRLECGKLETITR